MIGRAGRWHRARASLSVLLAAAMLSAVMMVFASPVSAAVPGLEQISATVPDSVGTAVARCPTGKVPIGAGGSVTGADEHVFISRISPGSIAAEFPGHSGRLPFSGS